MTETTEACVRGCSLYRQHLTDAVLAHIAAVLHDDATVEAVAQARRDHQYAGQWTWDRSAKVYLHECRCGEKANDLRAHEAEATIAVLAERLGVPHVDR